MAYVQLDLWVYYLRFDLIAKNPVDAVLVFFFLNLCSILLRRLDVVIKSKHLQEDNKQINGESDLCWKRKLELCFGKDSLICEAN